MRILHTADWHLGARLYEQDRLDEQMAFLNWLLKTVKEEKIDLFLLCGDIFDSFNPGNAAQTLFYDFLKGLISTDLRHSVLISGNHDSPSLLNAPSQLLKHFSIDIRTCLSRPEDFVLDLRAEAGAIVCALPYLRERDLRLPQLDESEQERDAALLQALAESYRQAFTQAQKIRGNALLPIIGLGHFFGGGRISSAERDLYVGSLGQVDLSLFPPELELLALGHLHSYSQLKAPFPCYYSGSPLPLAFDEKKEKKLLIYDFEGGVLKKTHQIPVPLFQEITALKGDFSQINQQLDQLVSQKSRAWLEVNLEVKNPATLEAAQLQQRIDSTEMILLNLKQQLPQSTLTFQEVPDLSFLSEEEVFARLCQEKGLEKEEIQELSVLFNSVLDQIKLEKQPEEVLSED